MAAGAVRARARAGGGDGEFKLRGQAYAVEDRALQRRYARQVTARLGWRPEPGHSHLFAVDIDDVTFIRYDDASGDQLVTRWLPGQEFVRRGTTATSPGAPQPLTSLLLPVQDSP